MAKDSNDEKSSAATPVAPKPVAAAPAATAAGQDAILQELQSQKQKPKHKEVPDNSEGLLKQMMALQQAASNFADGITNSDAASRRAPLDKFCKTYIGDPLDAKIGAGKDRVKDFVKEAAGNAWAALKSLGNTSSQKAELPNEVSSKLDAAVSAAPPAAPSAAPSEGNAPNSNRARI